MIVIGYQRLVSRIVKCHRHAATIVQITMIGSKRDIDHLGALQLMATLEGCRRRSILHTKHITNIRSTCSFSSIKRLGIAAEVGKIRNLRDSLNGLLGESVAIKCDL